MSDAMMASAGMRVGLHAANGPVPLEGVHIDAVMDGPCLQVAVRQRYRNTDTVPIEAVYVFPLPEDAAVCGFRARFGHERVDGRVQARDQAFETYDDALLDGRMAALLDQERPNVFTASLGNLPPGQEAVVEIRYVARLRPEGDGYRLTFPTTVSPRYVPSQPPEVGQPDGERVNPERWLAVPYGLQFDLRLGAGGLRSVESPSHPVRVSLTDDGAEVALAQESVALDRDLVVLVQRKAATAPSAIAVPAPDGGEIVLLDFLPDLPATDHAPREVVFLLDCSGSMGGTSIEEARRALQLCLRALHLGDRFDIVRFGSQFQSLWNAPTEFDDASLAAATAWLAATDAVLGGTEILAPLRRVLSRPVTPTHQRAVVLLTDGQVANEAEVIELAAKHAATTTVFAFGIGAGASDHLVRGIARAGRGEAEMIFPGERIEPKVLRTFARLRSPRLADVRLEMRDVDAQLAPRDLPPLFAESPFSLLVRYPARAPAALVLAAGEHRWEVAVARASARSDELAPIALCWARERIRDLEQPRTRGSRQRREAREDKRLAELVTLGEEFGLLSSETSYVAVSSRVVVQGQDAQLRNVPVALTSGWGGHAQRSAAGGGVQALRSLSAPPVIASMEVGDALATTWGRESDSAPARVRRRQEPPQLDYLDMPSFLRHSDDHRAPARDSRFSRLMALLVTQRADGRFEFSDALQTELGAAAALVDAWKSDSAAITVLVLHILAARYGEFVDETRLAVAKARLAVPVDEFTKAHARISEVIAAL